MRSAVILAAIAVGAAGCPVIYRGYQAYDGRVIDANTGKGIPDVRVIACLLDRQNSRQEPDCASAQQKQGVVTNGDGEFQIAGSHRIGLGLPVPEGMPGPYDTDLLFEKSGYRTKELYWWRDRDALAKQPLVVELDRIPASPEASPGEGKVSDEK